MCWDLTIIFGCGCQLGRKGIPCETVGSGNLCLVGLSVERFWAGDTRGKTVCKRHRKDPAATALHDMTLEEAFGLYKVPASFRKLASGLWVARWTVGSLYYWTGTSSQNDLDPKTEVEADDVAWTSERRDEGFQRVNIDTANMVDLL